MLAKLITKSGFVSNRVIYFFLASIWITSRIPLINLGYGTDADAWRVAYQGWRMANLGGYIWSRPPGYPIFEFCVSRLISYGWIATNLTSVFVGLVGAVIFWRLLVDHGRASRVVATSLTLVYGFAPVVWIASSTTIDYLFAETCILGSWYLMGQNKLSSSAIILGLAIGFRPTSAVFIFPMLLAIVIGKDSSSERKRVWLPLRYLVIFALSSLISFLPVLFTYGVTILPSLGPRPSLLIAIYHIAEVYGVFGLGGVSVLAMFLALRLLIHIRSNEVLNQFRTPDRAVIFAVFGLLSNMTLFAYFPDEAGYLIPAVPFLLFLLVIIFNFSMLSSTQSTQKFASQLFIVFALIVMINGVVDVRFWRRDEYGQMQIATPYIGRGFVLDDADRRYAIIDEAQHILGVGNFHKPCIILAGWHYPIIRVYRELLLQAEQPDCTISQSINKIDLLLALQENVTVYYTSGTQALTQSLYGYSFSDYPQTVYINMNK